ncbi:MAG: HlyC/CorC family transporter [Deltaproteobacteria bacterium]|nr:HlyC/CorC family transporter [Deltaproteobacteria bacterium]
MSILYFIICVFLISFSAFLASSEAALFSLSRFQLRALKERFRPTYTRIKALLNDPGGVLITILVTNEIVNVSLATLITHATSEYWNIQSSYFPEWTMQTWVGMIVTTPIILIFCEMTPKVIGAKFNHIVAPLTSTPLGFIFKIFAPLRTLIQWCAQKMLKILGKTTLKFQHQLDEPILREEEFLSIAEEGHKEGAIHQTELDLIKKIFDLDDRTVIDIYTPLSQVFSLPAHTLITSAINQIQGTGFSRIPVTDPSKKNILGILYAKDLLFSKLSPEHHEHHEHQEKIPDKTHDNTIDTLMRKPLIVSPAIRLNALFRKFKQQSTHLAVVTIGGTSGDVMGVVTMADILEPIFESIFQKKVLEGPTKHKEAHIPRGQHK